METQKTQESTDYFDINDFLMMRNVLEVVSQRGAIKADEMESVGRLFSKIQHYIAQSGASSK